MKYPKTIGLAILAILFINICSTKANSVSYATESKANKSLNHGEPDKHWTIAKLSDSLAKLNTKELVFMHEKSMQGTYIELNMRTSFNRKAINDDLYYLHKGSCVVYIDNHKKSFNSGDVIYVRQGSKLVIENIEEALQLVIVSRFLTSDSANPKWKHFSKKYMESTRSSNENVWNPFIMYSNVMLGLYMLPNDLDGDQRLVHEWQELNIITSGSSNFVMDSGSFEVEKGSIFFVDEGNGHYFNELDNDIDILILWEMRNVNHSDH